MGIDLYWDEQDTHLVRWKMHEDWDMNDVRETNEKALEWFAEREPDPIYVIVDLSASNAVPENFITGVSSVSRNSPSNWVMTVIVGSSAIIEKFFEIGFRLDGLVAEKYDLVNTVEDARQVIAERRKDEGHDGEVY